MKNLIQYHEQEIEKLDEEIEALVLRKNAKVEFLSLIQSKASQEPRKTKAKKEEIPVETVEDSAPETSEEPEVVETKSSKAKELELEDVISQMKKFSEKHGREKAGELLKGFKVKSVKDLKKEQYADVIKKAKV